MARPAPSRQAARAAARRAERRTAERDRRRQERARTAVRTQRATRRRYLFRKVRRWAVAAVATGLMASLWAGAPQPFRQPYIPSDAATGAYSITYSVYYLGGVRNTEQITVARPWYGKDITYRQGKIVAAELSNDQGLWDWSSNGKPGWFLLSEGRQRATSDAQPTMALNWGIDRSEAAVVGTDRVLGRPCTLVLTGEPAGQPVAAPTDSSRAELCIDRTGVPLRQVWYLDGKLAERMVATSFQPRFVPDGSTFQPTPRQPTTGKPPIQAVPLETATRQRIRPLLDPPAGFTAGPAYTTVEASPSGSGLPSFTTKEMYVGGGGTQLLELDYGAGSAPRHGIRVQLAGGHVAYLSLDLYASTLSLDVNGGASLIMYATDPSVLIRAGNRLRY